MRIVSWNMNHKGQSAQYRAAAWAYLRDELQADLALVQEASPPPDLMQVYRPIDKRRYNWGSAVVALTSAMSLRVRQRIPLADSYLKAVEGDELSDSHPGACAVADVLDANAEPLFTATSIYGQWEDMPSGSSYACARLHRMISDLTPVLAAARRKPMVLAGDMNITTQGMRTKGNQAEVIFARLRGWGLVDCLRHTKDTRSRLENCVCSDAEQCSHVRTFVRNRERAEAAQLDYAFASGTLSGRIQSCVVVDEPALWQLSDHCPIVMDLAL